jgi:hypothetical protein
MTQQEEQNWEVCCKGTFNNMKANQEHWNESFNWRRKISRDFYYGVFDARNPFPTDLISEQALDNQLNGKANLNTWDHYHCPQFVGRMIMENKERYLEDYDLFKSIFLVCTQQIRVTKKENDQLSALTDPDREEYKVLAATNLKYQHLGIKLYKRQEGKSRWKHSYPIDTNVLEIPEDLIEYEKKYLVIKRVKEPITIIEDCMR